MVLLFDALVAWFIFEMYGEQAIWVLGTTALISFLRLAIKVNWIFDGMETIVEMNKEEEE